MDSVSFSSLSIGGYDIEPQNPLDRLAPYRNDKSKRRKSFKKYPANAVIPQEKLIENGFYYIGDGKNDKVQCAHCGGVLSGWETGDDVRTEHRKFFPRCPLLGIGNSANFSYSNGPPSPTEDDDDLEMDGTTVISSQPVSTMDTISGHEIKYPKFKDRHDRLKSFSKWPKTAEVKDIISLANAGLFFTGTGDQCLCYMCGNMLEEWEEGDDPKKEHDKFFDDCPLAS